MNQLENLENWLGKRILKLEDDNNKVIDLVFEFLHDQKMLTDDGKKLAKDYWKKYVQEKKR